MSEIFAKNHLDRLVSKWFLIIGNRRPADEKGKMECNSSFAVCDDVGHELLQKQKLGALFCN